MARFFGCVFGFSAQVPIKIELGCCQSRMNWDVADLELRMLPILSLLKCRGMLARG
jgi:hypothetical protein